MTNAMENKRKHKRVRVAGQVAVLHKGQFHMESGVQVSEGGMLIQAARDYLPGEQVEVCFFIGPQDYVGTMAEVLYRLDQESGGSCFGLKFLNPSPETLDVIREYTAKQPSV